MYPLEIYVPKSIRLGLGMYYYEMKMYVDRWKTDGDFSSFYYSYSEMMEEAQYNLPLPEIETLTQIYNFVLEIAEEDGSNIVYR